MLGQLVVKGFKVRVQCPEREARVNSINQGDPKRSPVGVEVHNCGFPIGKGGCERGRARLHRPQKNNGVRLPNHNSGASTTSGAGGGKL